MKKVYLFRHAKSSWDYPELDDFERPLNKRGRTDLPLMGKVLNRLNIKPEIILSSPATRAAITAKRVCELLEIDESQLQFDTNIYESGPTYLLELVQRLPDKIGSVMLVGHNPALTSLANMLTQHQVSNIPTAGCYAIDFDVSEWSKLREKSGKFSFFEFPKKYYKQ